MPKKQKNKDKIEYFDLIKKIRKPVPPPTKVKGSKKVYDRKRDHHEKRKEESND